MSQYFNGEEMAALKRGTVFCPACRSGEVSEILYGPIKSKASKEEIASGIVVWGGPMVREEGPHWLCRECKTAWCRRERDLFIKDEFGEFVLKT